MLNALREFENRTVQLQSFLQDADAINTLIDLLASKKLITGDAKIDQSIKILTINNVDRKLQNYVYAIISLYGLFEQYIEDVLMGYVSELDNCIDQFVDLPEKIKKFHTTFSAQLLIKRDDDKYVERCNEYEIISHLQSCIVDGPFTLNPLAFIDHKSNFRTESLNQFFENVGISGLLTQVKLTKSYKKYYQAKFPENQLANLTDKVVFTDLEDLVWRRNIIAHGWPDDKLSNDLMLERIIFIQILGKSIYEVLRKNSLNQYVKFRCKPLPKPLAIFQNNVVCFHIESYQIEENSKIYARQSNGQYLEGIIKSIEIDHKKFTTISAPPAQDVGFQLDFTPRKSYSYYFENS